ncbi:MAG: hypothetical protein IJ860_00070 [Eubacterium sp.]|nr:hypothetical protein [Eubacterium sp.]
MASGLDKIRGAFNSVKESVTAGGQEKQKTDTAKKQEAASGASAEGKGEAKGVLTTRRAGSSGAKEKAGTRDRAGAKAQGGTRAEAGGKNQMTDADVQKLTRLELLEILVDQRKEIAALREKLAETQERLERDDALIKKFLLRDASDFKTSEFRSSELKVRREIKDE